MRQYKFDKPLVESTTPPADINCYWVDVDESTGKLLTIWEFDQENGCWAPIMIAEGKYMVVIHNFSPELLKVHCDKGFASAGDIITVTAEPAEGYGADIEVEWAGGDIEITETGENTWTFEMPEGNVAVKGSAIPEVDKSHYIVFEDYSGDTEIRSFSCSGPVLIESTKSGSTKKTIISEASSNIQVNIPSSAHSTTTIYGPTTELHFFRYGNGCRTLGSINADNSNTLTVLDLNNQSYLSSVMLSNNHSINTVDVSAIQSLCALGLNNEVTSLATSNNSSISEIYYNASNSDVSVSVADMISNSQQQGTVYTDSTGVGYSTIASAATTAGWTISPLS